MSCATYSTCISPCIIPILTTTGYIRRAGESHFTARCQHRQGRVTSPDSSPFARSGREIFEPIKMDTRKQHARLCGARKTVTLLSASVNWLMLILGSCLIAYYSVNPSLKILNKLQRFRFLHVYILSCFHDDHFSCTTTSSRAFINYFFIRSALRFTLCSF